MENTVSRIAIRLVIEGLGEAKGEIIRYLSPRTADALLRILPVEGRAALWKNEVYFTIPLKMGEEKPKDMVKKGALAYWPMGSALCIFYEDSKPYSAVNVIGQVTEKLEVFSQIKSGTPIRIERA